MLRKRTASEMDVDEEQSGSEAESDNSDSDSDDDLNISRPTAGRPQGNGQQTRPWARKKTSGSAKAKPAKGCELRMATVKFSNHDGTRGLGTAGLATSSSRLGRGA